MWLTSISVDFKKETSFHVRQSENVSHAVVSILCNTTLLCLRNSPGKGIFLTRDQAWGSRIAGRFFII